MDIQIDKNILDRIINDNIESELQQTILKELSKPYSEINFDKINNCLNTIELIKEDEI